MLRVEHITSLDIPELAPYRTMRRQLEHRQQGLFVAEGEKVVRRLIGSRFTIVSVLMPEHCLKELEPLLQARPENIRGYVAEKKLLETLTGFNLYQGLLAVGQVPAMPTLAELLRTITAPRLFVAVDGLTSAENLGALVRNAVALGAGVARGGNIQQPVPAPGGAEFDGDDLSTARGGTGKLGGDLAGVARTEHPLPRHSSTL